MNEDRNLSTTVAGLVGLTEETTRRECVLSAVRAHLAVQGPSAPIGTDGVGRIVAHLSAGRIDVHRQTIWRELKALEETGRLVEVSKNPRDGTVWRVE